MRNIWTRVVSIVFLAMAANVALAQPMLPPPSEALRGFSRQVRLLADLITRLEQRYPNAAIPLLKDVQANPQPWYHEQFAVLLQQSVAIDVNKTRVDWVFAKWPGNLAAVANALDTQYRSTGATPDLQPLFFNVQDSYVRTMAAAYLLIEGVKRQYLMAPWGPGFPGPAQRDFIASQLLELHIVAQGVAKWMYAFRCSTDFSFLFSLQYFAPNEAFEVRYRTNFFIGTPELAFDRTVDLACFMLPVATADEWKAKLVSGGVKLIALPAPVVANPAPVNPAPVNPAPVNPAPVNPAPVNPAPVNPAPVNPAPVNPAPTNPVVPVVPAPLNPPTPTDLAQWQRQWEDLQRQLAQNPDDITLRQRVWELQKLKNSLPAAQPAPVTAPAPIVSTPANPTPVNPAPAPSATNPEVERIKRLLQKPEVQSNAELRRELEELLKSLQPVQPAPAPVAPPTAPRTETASQK